MPDNNTNNSSPTMLTKCADAIPEMGITRQFDFGQFIELYQNPPENPILGQKPTPVRIVLDTSGVLGQEEQDNGIKQVQSPRMAVKSKVRSTSAAEPTVSLSGLLTNSQTPLSQSISVNIDNLDKLEEKPEVAVEGVKYKLVSPEKVLSALRSGLVVDAVAVPVENSIKQPSVVLQLTPPFTDLPLSDKDILSLFAGQSVQFNEDTYKPVLDASAIQTLRDGRIVMTCATRNYGKKVPVRLLPGPAGIPLSGSFQIHDLNGFLAKPALPDRHGKAIPLNLSTNQVSDLLNNGSTTLTVTESIVHLNVTTNYTLLRKDIDRPVAEGDFPGDSGDNGIDDTSGGVSTVYPIEMLPSAYAIFILNSLGHYVWSNNDHSPSQYGSSSAGGSGSQTAGDDGSLTDMVASRLPTREGLPVAVFVPWRQTWTLDGFSRGNLLQSIALAPQEELTLQVFSWERSSRTLEQSSETDTEQTSEFAQNTRDTEDVFKEMVSKRDFAWQVSGSVDASYSNGVASINVQAGGGVSDTTSIAQTVRNSSQSVKDSTVKASSRVRSKRVTRISQTVEQGREERTTRIIRNPNQCHTLTMDFFETLAHYTITLEFLAERLRLVVLIPNPIQISDFNSEVVRRNESSLRNALLEPALADGFDACRMVAAYKEAKDLLVEQKKDAVILDDLPAQRSDPPSGGASMPSPAEQQLAELSRVVNLMVSVIKTIRSQANIDPAMAAIRNKPDRLSVSEQDRRKGQYWLFINLCAAKFPALLTVLDDIAADKGGSTIVEKAQHLLNALPKPDAPTNLDNLSQLSDKEKEEGGLASKIHSQPGYIFWDWGFWTSSLKDEGLYTPNDAGLAGMADQLSRAYQEWQAKQAQGDAMKSADVAKTEAEGRQDKASTDDKLSMAFPLEELAKARERQRILCSHFNDHKDHYNYALFQSLPVTEQAVRIVAASDGKLSVGMFEPRVVAMNGRYLAVPLTPLVTSSLSTFAESLRTTLKEAFDNAKFTPDNTVLPTPGVSVTTRLGACSGCEEYIETAREHELKRLDALARQEAAEADRREGLIKKEDLEPFTPAAQGLQVNINKSNE